MRRFEDFYGTPAAEYQKSPRFDAAHYLDDAVVAVQKNGIDWIGHKKSVDGIAPQNEHTFARQWLLPADKSTCALHEGSRNLSLDPGYLNSFHKTSLHCAR